MEKKIIQQDNAVTIKQEPMSLQALCDNKTRGEYEKINNILMKTNYYSLMDEFIRSPTVCTIEMRLSQEVSDKLLYFDRDHIQDAVKNPFEFEERMELIGEEIVTVWGYDKYYDIDYFSFEKLKRFSRAYAFIIGMSWIVWFILLCSSIILLSGHYCLFNLLLFAISIILLSIPILITLEFYRTGYFKSIRYTDFSALLSLPVIDFTADGNQLLSLF